MPTRRWKTRVLLPLTLLTAAAALLGYAARQALLPAVHVQAALVVAFEDHGAAPSGHDANSRGRVMTVQAPGWIEPDPFPVSVPALADGVVREVLVLEGERVEAGDVVARLIEDDARIAVRMAEAALAVKQSEVHAAEARVRIATAQTHAEQAAADEVRDEVDRKRPLAADQTIPYGDYRRLELRLHALEARAMAARAALAEAQALLEQARADADLADVQLDAARLTLERMEIRSPASGIVLARLAEPGSRMMTQGQEPNYAIALRLYDPERLQVRVDIPLADAAKVGLGQEAEITTEAVPDRIFTGRVTRLVQEANIQKNTVQVKVGILDPTHVLKPEMLARVRFFRSAQREVDAEQSNTAGSAYAVKIFAPAAALLEISENRARALVIDEQHSTAVERDLTLGADTRGTWRQVRSGLAPGDRVIVNPPQHLRTGTRVRATTTDSFNAGQQETQP